MVRKKNVAASQRVAHTKFEVPKKILVELREALIDDTASSDKMFASWSFRDTSSLVTSSFQWSLRKSAQFSIFIWEDL